MGSLDRCSSVRFGLECSKIYCISKGRETIFSNWFIVARMRNTSRRRKIKRTETRAVLAGPAPTLHFNVDL